MPKTETSKVQKSKQVLSSNNWLSWTLRIVLVLYASFAAPNLSSGLAHIFDNIIVRLILSGLIIWLSYVDPSSAILLAVGFVISIQTLNKHKISHVSNQLNESFDAHSDTNGSVNDNDESNGMMMMSDDKEQKEQDVNDKMMPEIGDNFQNYSGTIESFENKIDDEYHDAHQIEQQPMEETQPMIENQNVFTTDNQLRDTQMNQTQNNNQNTQVQTFAQQLGPQGFGEPSGFNFPGIGKLTDAANFSSCN